MPLKQLRRKIAKSYYNLSLQNILTLPFLLQIFITVSLVGYFSWRNGQQAVNNVASELRNEVTLNVKQHIDNYLEKPQLIVELNQKAAKLDQLSLVDLQGIETDFWQQIQIFNSVYAIYWGNEQGKFAYVKRENNNSLVAKPVTVPPERQAYLLDNKGKRSKLIDSDRYDPRDRPWYKKTLDTGNNNWSSIYSFSGGELGITAAGALYDKAGKFQGVVGVDLILCNIGNFLKSIEISNNGEVFILERNGYLVATSTDEKPFVRNAKDGTEARLLATESQSFLVEGTSEHLIQHFGSLNSIKQIEQLDFKLDGERQLVQVLPYKDKLGLDWLIVVVVPEADFMLQIDANTRNTIFLCLGALLGTTAIGFYTSRKIVQPITHLSHVSSIITKSARSRNTDTDFYPLVKAKSIKELSVLAQSFNEMAFQLKAAFQDLEKTNEELENRVKERTAALVAAKEAADAANQAKSEFLARMSHELRTPLHAILGFTQIALQDSSLKPQQQENLKTVKRSGEHLLALINDVLEMSRIESGRVTLKQQKFDLYSLLRNLQELLTPKAQTKKISLILDRDRHLPQYIQTDGEKLRQVLINLMDNGIKFTQQGQVSLQVKLANKTNNNPEKVIIAFEIQDTGCGIAPSAQNTIFDAFVRAEKISEHEGKNGTGLGLAISQQFVHLLGGEIVVHSNLNKGTSFWFQIPVTVVEKSEENFTYPSQQIIEPNPEKYQENSHHRDTILQPSAFVSMSPQWIAQLRQAAIAVDRDLILELIPQIPPENAFVAQKLKDMVQNFEYDEIIELTER
jgi:signal transduction histidine kinase